MTSKTKRVRAIDIANAIIYGDREQTYGSPDKNLRKIAEQWALYIEQKYGHSVELTAEDVCWMMADLKKVRQINKGKQDNLTDAIGYIALIDRINTKE
jgi:hypothetical protein